jgi:ribosome biogenesis protein Nip4
MFRTQSNIQALLTDQAAQNAAKQFNASSENQTNQFFSDLTSRANQFNVEQSNAIKQFNAGETNAAEKFNAQLEAQREQFNATNSLVIAQANAQWRQNTATLNTAAQNDANRDTAAASNALTSKALDEIWQKERDAMAFAFTSTESSKDRAIEIMLADKRDELIEKQSNDAEKAAMASLFAKILF